MRSPLPGAFFDHVILGTRVSEPTASAAILIKAARLTQNKDDGRLAGRLCHNAPPVTINNRLSACRRLLFLYLAGKPKLAQLGLA